MKRSKLPIRDNNIQGFDFRAGNHFLGVGVTFFQMIHVLIWNRLYFDTEYETMNTNQLAGYVPTVLSNRSKITSGADSNPHASSPLSYVISFVQQMQSPLHQQCN